MTTTSVGASADTIRLLRTYHEPGEKQQKIVVSAGDVGDWQGDYNNTILGAGDRLVIVRSQAAFEVRYAAKLGAITYSLEISTNLVDWAGGAPVVFVSEIDGGAGTSTVTYRSANPVSGDVREFIRLSVTQ